MSFNTILRQVISVASSAELPISIVEGLRSEDLPTPCISVHLESATSYNTSLTDVFNMLFTVKYEEHYADQSSETVNNNFKLLLDQFIVDDITKKLSTESSKVFNANVTDIETTVSGDFFVNQFSIQMIAERDS